jgi:predicted hydrocarbon binding protein
VIKESAQAMNNKTRIKYLSLLEKTEYFDDEGEWRIAGSDYLIIGGSALRAWAKATEAALGLSARVIILEAGKKAGEQFADALLKQGLKPEDMEEPLELFLTRGGWGKVWAKIDVKEQTAVFLVWNSVLARQTTAQKPICHFISGYFAGVLSVLFGKDVECLETKCSANNDRYCEFQTNSDSYDQWTRTHPRKIGA